MMTYDGERAHLLTVVLAKIKQVAWGLKRLDRDGRALNSQDQRGNAISSF